MDRDALIDASMNAYLDFFGYSELNREREAFARVLDAIAPAIRAAALEEAAERVRLYWQEERLPLAQRSHGADGGIIGAIRALINAPPTTP